MYAIPHIRGHKSSCSSTKEPTVIHLSNYTLGKGESFKDSCSC